MRSWGGRVVLSAAVLAVAERRSTITIFFLLTISAGNLAWGPKAAKNLTEAFDKFLTGASVRAGGAHVALQRPLRRVSLRVREWS